MLMSNDLRCAACDYTEIDAIYERNDGPPVCPDCGRERFVDWSTGRAPAISGHGGPSPSPSGVCLPPFDAFHRHSSAISVIPLCRCASCLELR